MRRTRPLAGWRLYLALIGVTFAMVPLMWMRSMGHHPHQSILEPLPVIMVFAGVTAICLIVAVARDNR